MLPPGAMPMPPYLSCQRVRNIIAIQIHGRDDIEFIRPGQDLLQRDVGDRILDDDFAGEFRGVHLRVGFAFSP